MTSKIPVVKGGQGRSDDDQQRAGQAIAWLCFAALSFGAWMLLAKALGWW